MVIYEKKAPFNTTAGLHGVPRNVAGEATAFLKFVLDYYDELPVRMLFLHSHRWAYHQEDILVRGHSGIALETGSGQGAHNFVE